MNDDYIKYFEKKRLIVGENVFLFFFLSLISEQTWK